MSPKGAKFGFYDMPAPGISPYQCVVAHWGALSGGSLRAAYTLNQTVDSDKPLKSARSYVSQQLMLVLTAYRARPHFVQKLMVDRDAVGAIPINY
jgi:hypothetical protein